MSGYVMSAEIASAPAGRTSAVGAWYKSVVLLNCRTEAAEVDSADAGTAIASRASTTSAGRCLVLTIPYRPSPPTASGKSAIGDLFLIPAF